MSFIEHILSYFGYFKIKEEKQETPNAISNIIWGVGFNLTEEQRKKVGSLHFIQLFQNLQ